MAGIKNSFLWKFFLAWAVLSFSLTSCSQLAQLQTDTTPEEWLASHSHIRIQSANLDFVFAEPSSTIFVYGLGLVLLWATWQFYAHKKESTTGRLWSLGLFIWALSTFSAGTSYQAFSYEIKCAGKALCSWTSWWEIWYMALYVLSMGTIAVAVAFSSLSQNARKPFLVYVLAITFIYEILLFSGALLPNQLMVSFEFMLLFVIPTFLALFAINLSGYKRHKKPLELRLILAWLLMAVVTGAYFGFLLSGISSQLWESGIWFNANDVLHIGLIGWVLYLVFRCKDLIADKAP